MSAGGLGCAECPVRDRAACSALEPQEREELARAGRIRTLKRGETLFAAGDRNDACATLIEGALKVTSFDSQGVERILALVHPSGFTGELFAPFTHHDVVALTDSRLCVFSRAQLESAIERYPALAQALLRRSQEEIHETRELIELMGRRGAAGKVAGLLVAMSRAASTSPCHGAQSFDLPLTRGEIAGLLGLTIETVSRQLGALEAKGLIARHGARGIDMRQPRQLEALVD
ncbi:Crp/Fnr family transcriptional regulator [Novosphingobium tardum]|uniref:Crp/Fnr family transcriptional regulator n=1 Tax=Novosphingobium tardum TaxID=1538021 RepID=A0ABV8RQ63_9SPHN